MSYEQLSQVYRRLFGAPPPRAFRQAYSFVREALYWGVAKKDNEEHVIRRRKPRRPGEHWPLHRWELLEPKATADLVIAEITRALQRWEARSKAGRRPPPDDGR